MSDTIELWELCPHGQAYAHDVVIDGSGVRANATMEHCDGGKKHVMMPVVTWDGDEPIVTLDGTIGVWVELADE